MFFLCFSVVAGKVLIINEGQVHWEVEMAKYSKLFFEINVKLSVELVIFIATSLRIRRRLLGRWKYLFLLFGRAVNMMQVFRWCERC